jgi:toxin YoeB
MKIIFLSSAWEDYLYWQQTDKKTIKNINELIKVSMRSPYDGIGKPEPLKYELSGWWSRRINLEHRLVYKTDNDSFYILQCRYHY